VSAERAKEEALAGLHAKLAETLTDAIVKGEPLRLPNGTAVVDPETGVLERGPASAAILNVARQFLKDNDIKTLPTGQTPMERLGAAMPKGTTLPFEGEARSH
jgi:hypothetical protein